MKILRLAFCNLNSLRGEFSVDFTGYPFESAGLFAVTGPTGAGKSTVFDAVSLALYGETPRLRKRSSSGEGIYEIVSRHTAEAWAEVEFQVPSGNYRSRWETHRARGSVKGAFQQPRMRLQRTASGLKDTDELLEEKLSEVPSRVTDLTGLDFTRFTRSMLLAQGAFSAFLEASPSERAELLEKMTGSFIYSEVSRLAYERAREEEQKEAELKKRLEDLPVLDEDAHRLLEFSLGEIRNRRKESLADRDLLITSLEKSRRRNFLTSEQGKLTVQLDSLDGRREEMTALRKALELHDKVLPHRGDLQNLERLVQQESAHSERIELLEEQTGKADAEAQVLLGQMENAAADIGIKKESLKELLRIQQQAEKIAITISGFDTRIADEDRRQRDIRERLLKRKEEVEAGRSRIADISEELKGHEVLVSSRAFADLHDEIGLIRIRLKEKSEAEESLGSLDEDLRECRLRLADLEDESGEGHGDTGGEEELLRCRSQFEEIDTRIGLLPERKLLSEERKSLEKKLSTAQFIEEQRNERKSLETEIAAIGDDLSLVDAEFTTRQKHAEGLKNRLDARRSNALASAAAVLRGALRKGRPCPVCGAKDHPSTDQGELFDSPEGLVQEDDGVEEEYRQSLILLAESGEGRKHLHKSIAEKEELLRSLKGNHEDSDTYSDISGIEKEISSLENQQELLDNLESKRTDLFHRLSDLTESARVRSSELQKRQHDAVVCRQRLERLEQERGRLLDTVVLADGFLEKILVPAGLEPSADNIEALIEDSLRRFRTAVESHRTLSGEIRSIEERTALFEKEISSVQAEVEAGDAVLDKITSERGEQTARLWELTGGGDPDEMVRKGELDLSTAEAAESAVKQKLAAVREESARLQGLCAAAEENRKQIIIDKDNMESFLLETARSLGFNSLPAFSAALLDNYISRKQELEGFESRRNDLIREIRTIDTELNSLQDVSNDLSRLEAELASLDEHLDQLQQEQFSMMQQLDREREHRKLRDSLEIQLTDQSREFVLWWRLRQVIGSARGDVFRRFAQGLTLDFLIRLANGHLNRFSGRYRLQRQQGDELSLEISDTWQADTVRPVATLSGGETFLVSLSLALGLSELAGRKTRIDSLFLDEGFGTLDAETLETVLAALDTLQSGGKLIGVISHVEVLKERIPVQIRISRKGAGSSTIKVVPEPVA